MPTDERLAALEAEISVLRGRVAMLEASRHAEVRAH